jgi:hypothetical protein
MAVQSGEFLKLAEQQAVFIQRRLAPVSSFGVQQELVAGFLDGEGLWFFDLLAFRFLPAH